jgi:hypothetical protein
MIIRNPDTWKYIQATGGVEALLRLMRKGNSSLRILACSAISSDILKPGIIGTAFMVDVVQRGVIAILQLLLADPDPDVRNSALGLIAVVIPSLKAREQILEPQFLCALADNLRNQDLTVMNSACHVFVMLGAENQSELRAAIYKVQLENATEEVQYLSSTVGRLVDLTQGRVVSVQPPVGGLGEVSAVMLQKELDEQAMLRQEVQTLSNTAADVLAAMTDDGDDWPDGAPPLRRTLVAAGILPEIDSV